ncbi:MAG: extracellular solute-binding protein [Epulopiscium sp.]|nr:extracellular solute-binding protein [Candidatus Epulonipiscium sp.]
MKKNFLSKAASLLTMALLVASLAACGGKDKGNVNEPPKTDGGTKVEENKGTDKEEVKEEVAKPDKIHVMMTTILTEENGQKALIDKYKEITGIDLEITKPDHNQFYEKVNLAFASGDVPDIIELGGTNYTSYAVNGALWDMTDAWENSELKASGILKEQYVDALKIDGKLFGFPMAKGNGTLTYVRGDWMEKLNLKAPTNYDEFLDMLRAFTNDDPDGNGQKDTYGITAAGLINSETPYEIYLREFYQDAIPDFYEEGGKYVDGMSQPAMKAALQRMRDAYAEGLIDREIVTNKTSTCRDKFYAGQVGAFNYWAGFWNVNLENNLQAVNPDGKVMGLEPIKEAQYIERPPTAMVITNAAKNPEGIFKYLIEFSHDAGEGEMLFTRGVEGVHYEVKDGKTVAMNQMAAPDKVFEKAFYSPELTITNFENPIALDERVINSLEIFEANSFIYPIPRSSEVIAENLPELNTIKSQVIAQVVVGEMTVDEGIAHYETQAKPYIEAILADLNK